MTPREQQQNERHKIMHIDSGETIRVGDTFDWQPYETEGWPHATELGLHVVDIWTWDANSPDGKDHMQSTEDACADDDISEIYIVTLTRDGKRATNDLRHFREMATKRLDAANLTPPDATPPADTEQPAKGEGE